MNNLVKFILEKKKKKKGVPFCAYIYDLKALRNHVVKVVKHLPDNCFMYYAVKANAHPNIISALAPIVHGFEVASGGEIRKVRAVCPEAELIFGGPGKVDDELHEAITKKVKYIHVESLQELNRLKEIVHHRRDKVSILLRVNLRDALPVGRLQMAGTATQFGIDELEVETVLAEALEDRYIQVAGFHFHALSNNLDEEEHLRFISHCYEKSEMWAERFGIPISVVNVGGGIGINYDDVEKQFSWSSFTEKLSEYLPKKENFPALYFECGRYLTAFSGYYIAEVLDIKQNHGKWFVILRGGSHHFRLPAAWKHNHPFEVIEVDDWPYSFSRPELCRERITVAGELCTPNDILARDVFIERLQIGDLLLFQMAGAYGWDISHRDFLSHSYPQQLFME